MLIQSLMAYLGLVSVWLLFWVPTYLLEESTNGDTKTPAQALVASPLSPVILLVFLVWVLYRSIVSVPKIFREAFSKE